MLEISTDVMLLSVYCILRGFHGEGAGGTVFKGRAIGQPISCYCKIDQRREFMLYLLERVGREKM